MEISDRVLGSIVGGAIGDAMGGPYEGQFGPVVINPEVPWFLSDDTQLTLATCEAIIETGSVSPERIAARFLVWFREGRITGIGASTFKALSNLSVGAHWSLAGREGEMAAGNGAAMRAAPLAFCLDPYVLEQRTLIYDISRITHRNREAYAGALAIVVAIRAMVSGTWSPESSLPAQVAAVLPDSAVRERLSAIGEWKPTAHPAGIANRFGCSGYVVESVPLAIFAAQQVAGLGLRDVLESAIQCGGDTDTIASMAGQIAGAWLGFACIPPELVGCLPKSPDALSTARSFAARLAHDI